MMKRIYDIRIIGLLIYLWMNLCGCSEDFGISSGRYTGPTLSVPVSIDLQNGGFTDQSIQSMRIVVFTSGGAFVSNTFVSATNGDISTIHVPVAQDGTNNFHTVCNEPAELTPRLETVQTAEALEVLTFAVEPMLNTVSSPIVLYGAEKEIEVKLQGTDVTVKRPTDATPSDKLIMHLKRTMAMLSLTVVKNTDEFTIQKMSYRLTRVPHTATIGEENAYNGTDWAEELEVNVSGGLSDNGSYNADWTIKEGPSLVFPEVYIPENILADKFDANRNTYLIISATCQKSDDNSVVDVLYRVDLGSDPPAKTDIKRNVHYRIYATVTELGAMGFNAAIVPAKMVELPVTWKEYEGLIVTSDLEKDFGLNKDVYMDYSYYFGVLKMNKGVSGGGIKNVVFKRGGVLAINSDAALPTPPLYYASDQVLYKPKTFAGAVNAWTDIPSQATDMPEHTPDNVKLGLGDPCRLVGLTDADIENGTIDNGMWRMAQPADYEHLIKTRNVGENNAKGYKALHYITLPNAAWRDATGLLSLLTNHQGHYWSSDGTLFSFDSQNMDAGKVESAGILGKAYSIRCVRVEPPVSSFSINSGAEIGYSGSTVSFGPNSVLVPYWTIEYVEGDDPAQVNFNKVEGQFGEKLSYTVNTSSPEHYTFRKFTYKITAYGLENGFIKEYSYTIMQKTLEHIIAPTYEPMIITEDGKYSRVPLGGTTYTVRITVSPELPNEYAAALKWKVYFTTVNSDGTLARLTESVEVTGTDNTATITVPRNESGDSRTVVFEYTVNNLNALNTQHGKNVPPIKYDKKIMIQE